MDDQLKELKEIVLNGFRRVEEKFDHVDNELTDIRTELANKPDRKELDDVKKDLVIVKKDLAIVRNELASKPDRDEVRRIVHDEIKSDPYVHTVEKRL